MVPWKTVLVTKSDDLSSINPWAHMAEGET